MSEHTNRRRFLAGIGAAGTAVGLAGCVGIPGTGPNVDMQYGDDIEGEITDESPEDPIYDDLAVPHTFQGSENDDVQLEMTSEEFDTYLVVTDEDEDMVAEDDDGGELFNSAMEFELDEDGVYTIWAGSFTGDATGDYELELDED